jgi:endonuclease/exonuclease/phosphatase family metal-dependent hydrolase
MRRLLLLSVALAFVACSADRVAGPAAEDVTSVEPDFHALGLASHLTVMTQNMYVGAAVEPILAAPQDQVPFVVAQAWAELLQTNYPARARAMADEMRRVRPDVVALQEVSLLRSQTPGDFLNPDGSVNNPLPNATTVEIDFLPTLLAELNKRGLAYEVASINENIDLELPRFDGLVGGVPQFTDIRLTDFDALLVRKGVAWSNPASAIYQAALPVNSILTIHRGWTAADVTVKGRTYRVVSTHLESAVEEVKFYQAQELAATFAGETRPLIIMGDFNSGPGRDIAEGGQQTYDFMIGAGYTDAWVERLGLRIPGYTCCHAGDLSNRTPRGFLTERIDLVLMRNVGEFGGRFRTNRVHAWLLGDNVWDLWHYGTWPSDHAALAAWLTFPQAGIAD